MKKILSYNEYVDQRRNVFEHKCEIPKKKLVYKFGYGKTVSRSIDEDIEDYEEDTLDNDNLKDYTD